MPRSIYYLFIVSGFCGLLYEIVWTRLMVRIIGVGTTAGACVLAAFMAGLAIGAVGGRFLPKKFGAVAAFGALELACSLYAAATPFLLSGSVCEIFWKLFPAPPLESVMVTTLPGAVFAFLVLLIPCSLMGATFPVLLRAMDPQAEKQALLLYGLNSLGATIGALAGGFFLLPELGFSTAIYLGAAMQAAVGGAALLASRNLEPPFISETGDVQEISGMRPISLLQGRRHLARLLLLLVSVSSILTMLLQVVWYRLYILVLGNSVASNSVVSSTVLVAVFLSSALAARFGKTSRAALAAIAGSLSAAAVLVAASIYALPYVPFLWRLTGAPADGDWFLRVAVAVVLIFLPSLGLSFVFPFVIQAQKFYGGAGSHAGELTSDAYLVSCGAGAFGAMLTGLVVMPQLCESQNYALLTCFRSAAVIVGVCACVSSVVLMRSKLQKALLAGLNLSVSVLVILCPPVWDPAIMSMGLSFFKSGDLLAATPADLLPRKDRGVMFYSEGLNSTVTITRGANSLSLRNDGKVEATLAADRSLPSPGADDPTHVLLGALPIILHEGKVNELFLVGMGSGTTCSAAVALDVVKSIVVAELEPSVSRAAEALRDYNGMEIKPLSYGDSGRTTVGRGQASDVEDETTSQRFDRMGKSVAADARHMLATASRNFDVIVCQAGDPWVTGCGDLYTKEFWSMAKSRLNPRGICCQWIPAYGVSRRDFARLLKTFHAVYPQMLVAHVPGAGEVILLGFNGVPVADWSSIDKRLHRAYASRYLLARSGVTRVGDILALVKIDGPLLTGLLSEFASDPLVCDDRPFLEYGLDPDPDIQDRLCRDNIAWLLSPRSADGDMYDRLLKLDTYPRRLAEVGRGFKLQALDGGPAQAFNSAMASLLVDEALRKKRSPYAVWSKLLIDGSQADYEARRALFDEKLKENEPQDLLAFTDAALSACDLELARKFAALLPQSEKADLRKIWIELSGASPQGPLTSAWASARDSALASTEQKLLVASAIICRDQGDRESGKTYIVRALELDPYSSWLQDVMADMVAPGSHKESSARALVAEKLREMVSGRSKETPEKTGENTESVSDVLRKSRESALDLNNGYKMFGIP